MARKLCVGLITNSEYGVFQKAIIDGVQDVIKKRGGELMIDSLLNEETREVRAPVLDYLRVDGIVAVANAVPESYLQAAHAARTPISLVSHTILNAPFPSVRFNNAQGISLLVRHLVETCNRRRIAFVRGLPDQVDARDREAAFRAELRRYAIPQDESLFVDGDFAPEVALAHIVPLLESHTPFDAILCADYLMAAAIVDYLRQNGIQIPERVAVVGFGDAPEAENAGLTTTAADVIELGRRTAYQLLHQIDGLKMRGTTFLRVQLVVRQTT